MCHRRPRSLIALLLTLALSPALGCTRFKAANTAPSSLSATGKVDWYGTRAIRAIDTLRDVAQDGAALTPPVISVDAARKVTAWHEAAITTIHAAPAGWQATVGTGLSQLRGELPRAEQQSLAPYFALAQAVLKEIQ